MTTTRAAIQNDEGPRLHYILAIEAYGKLITDGPAAAALTSFAGTDYLGALGGLQVVGGIDQTLKPWDPELDIGRLSFGVHDDSGTDEFGTLVGAPGAGVQTYLNGALGCTDTTVVVDSTAGFDASGYIWIGIECIAYSGKTATTFTGCTRGMFSPFRANTDSANRFGRAHPLPGVGDGQNTVIRPKVTSAPRTWRGRMVGLWIVRVVGGVFDVKAESQCIWAGRVVDTGDATNGMTALECEDIRATIRDCMLLRDQFSCRIAEGVKLTAGMKHHATDQKNAGSADKVANDLVVVASGAAGAAAGEINEGFYTADEYSSEINTWLGAEFAATRLNFSWTTNPRHPSADGTFRWRFSWSGGAAADFNRAYFSFPTDAIARSMGWSEHSFIEIFPNAATHQLDSPDIPYRVPPPAFGQGILIDDIRGKWENNTPYWPSNMGYPNDYPGTETGSHAILKSSGGGLVLVEAVDSATAPTELRIAGANIPFLNNVAGVGFENLELDTGIRLGDERDLSLSQVWIYGAGLRTSLTTLFASTGTAGYNHATYDAFPAQLGAAIPWETLGTVWTLSIGALDGLDNDGLLLVIEKPTKLSEVIACEMVSRLASIVLKPAAGGTWGATGGIIKAATWGTPVASLATHTLNETNKAVPVNTARERHRTTTKASSVALSNHIRLDYNRDLSGGYRDHINIVAPGSISDLGVTRGPTISMRNSFSARGVSSSGIERIRDSIASAMEMFSRPLHTMSRTIDQSLFDGVCVGDFGTISDNFARDPLTGARGLTAKAHLLIGHHIDFGGWEIDTERRRDQRGTVDVLILPRNDIVAYSPCAMVDHSQANAGLSGGDKVLTCFAHQHSESSEVADATRFVAGDKVRIIEIDPDDPAAPDTWLRTVGSQTGNTISVTVALSAPAWNTAKYYRVVPDAYTAVVTTQKATAYIADDADSLIAAGVNANVYGYTPQQSQGVEPTGSGSGPAALYAAASHAVAAAFDTGYEDDAAVLLNNLTRKRTLVNQPQLYRTVVVAGTGAFDWTIVEQRLLHFGPGNFGVGTRSVRLAPMFRRGAAGAGVTLRATLCRLPVSGSSWTMTDSNNPEYQLNGPMGDTLTWISATTAWATASSGDLLITPTDPLTGLVWLVVEAEPNVEYRGMAQVQDLGFRQDSDP